ncbi:MAG: Hint domain-containing protein, partial [Halocynthiibacter sp.]
DNFNTEMDGLTVTLSLKVPTIPNQPNTFKFAIADGGDESFDTNVLIAADSVQTVLIASGDSITAPLTGTKSIDVLANDTTSSGTAMTITHINDIPVSIGDTVTLPSGEQVTLLPSGHLDIQGTGVAGTTAVFTYTVEDAVGNTDVDFVEITNNIPCFTAGTLFETQNGQTPIEQLVAGDMIKNASGDWKKLLWVGYRCIIPETGTHPIRISKGTLGALCDIEVSPNHRLLLKGYMAEMLFGVDEVLVAAKHLINDHSIRAVTEATEVTYFHLAFADHEILNTSGLESESFFIGDQSLNALLSEQRSEIMSKFPELFAQNVMDLQTARTCLKFHEGAVLATVLNSGAQTTVKP